MTKTLPTVGKLLRPLFNRFAKGVTKALKPYQPAPPSARASTVIPLGMPRGFDLSLAAHARRVIDACGGSRELAAGVLKVSTKTIGKILASAAVKKSKSRKTRKATSAPKPKTKPTTSKKQGDK